MSVFGERVRESVCICVCVCVCVCEREREKERECERANSSQPTNKHRSEPVV